MHRVTAMGETVLDIIFRNMQPVAAVPGGSSFNSVISMGRAGLDCQFVGYTGDDIVGQQTTAFLQENGVSTEYFEQRKGEKSAISLAYLNDSCDANYVFYKPTPTASAQTLIPHFKNDDILLYGSYYACCEGMRQQVTQVLSEAHKSGAVVYYDINIRKSHQHELPTLMANIEWNMHHSTIARGSADDFDVMFQQRNASDIYRDHISAHCPIFICTDGADAVTICTPSGEYRFQTPPVADVVSTVGAGDNFNAGLIYALIREGITAPMLSTLSEEQWRPLIAIACKFAAQACRSTENYISEVPVL